MCSHKHCQKTVTCFPFRLSAEKSSAPLDKLSSCSPTYLQLKIKVEKKKICMFKLNPNMQSSDHCYLCFIFFLKKKKRNHCADLFSKSFPNSHSCCFAYLLQEKRLMMMMMMETHANVLDSWLDECRQTRCCLLVPDASPAV